MTILTLTMNSTIDISLEVDQLIDEGKNRARVATVRSGGGGINVARCIRRLGGQVTAVHTAGRENGARLNRLLDEEGMEHIPIRINDDTREAFVILERATGRSYHLVPPGPLLSDTDTRRCLDAIDTTAHGCSHLVVTGSVPPGVPADFCAEAIRRGHAAGAAVVLDIAGAQLAKALGERALVVRLDRHEAMGLIGRPIISFDDARAANNRVLDAGAADIAITTVGALGSVCSTFEYHQEISAPPLPSPARSDACAGDSLVAAVTYQLALGRDYVRAGAYGVAAAAATVLLPGTDVFDRAGVEALLPGVTVRQQRR